MPNSSQHSRTGCGAGIRLGGSAWPSTVSMELARPFSQTSWPTGSWRAAALWCGASIDGFHRPRAERYRLGRTSPEGFQAGADTVLVFDGIFLHRPELREQWDFSIFLQVGFDVSVARFASRDGTSPDPFAGVNQRYVEGQRRYFHDARPWRQATVVVDNTNLAEPSIVAPDRVTLGWNP